MEKYDYSSLLLVGEFSSLCAYMTTFGPNRADDTDIKHLEGVAKLKRLALTSKKMVMLAGIYGVMNLLSFISLARISAVEFTVSSQLKILMTAVFVILFQRQISSTKWRALSCWYAASFGLESDKTADESSSTGNDRSGFGVVVGYCAVLIQVCMSGFAVCTLKVIKSSTERLSIWDEIFSLQVAVSFSTSSPTYFKDCSEITKTLLDRVDFLLAEFYNVALVNLERRRWYTAALTFKHADLF